MTSIQPQCFDCKRYRGGTQDPETLERYHFCEAFKKIPREILFNEVIHDHPVKGDGGLFFVPREAA